MIAMCYMLYILYVQCLECLVVVGSTLFDSTQFDIAVCDMEHMTGEFIVN